MSGRFKEEKCRSSDENCSSRVYMPWDAPPPDVIQPVFVIGYNQGQHERQYQQISDQKISDQKPPTNESLNIPVVMITIGNKINPRELKVGPYPNRVYISFFPTQDGVTSTSTTLIDGVERWFMNRISPKFQHCQIIFSWISPTGTEELNTTFSTTMQRPSSFISTTYQRKGWVCMALNLEDVKYRVMWDMCKRMQKIPFNTFAYYWNFLPCVPRLCMYDSKGVSYFCAEQVATILRDVGIKEFETVEPYDCTPDDIYVRICDMRLKGHAQLVNLNFKFYQQPIVAPQGIPMTDEEPSASCSSSSSSSTTKLQSNSPTQQRHQVSFSVRENESSTRPSTKVNTWNSLGILPEYFQHKKK